MMDIETDIEGLRWQVLNWIHLDLNIKIVTKNRFQEKAEILRK
jgi:hypothetical protein